MKQLLPESVALGSDFFNGDNWCLITDSQDVQHTLDYLSKRTMRYAKQNGIEGLFVLVGDAEYDAVYGFIGSVPYTWKNAERLYPPVFSIGDIVLSFGIRYRVKDVYRNGQLRLRTIGDRSGGMHDQDENPENCTLAGRSGS